MNIGCFFRVRIRDQATGDIRPMDAQLWLKMISQEFNGFRFFRSILCRSFQTSIVKMDVSGGYLVDHPAIALEVAVEPFPVPGAKRWRGPSGSVPIHHGFWDEGTKG